MARLTAKHTLSNVEGLTRYQVIDRALRDSGFGSYGTATGGSTTTLVDANALISTQLPSTSFVGSWLRIALDAGSPGSAPEGEYRTVSSFAAGTGTLTVSSAFSAAVASGDRYQVFRVVPPQAVLDTLDTILKEEVVLPDFTLLTEMPDGDMEQPNTTDWFAVNASLSKVTAEPSLWGRRWLRVTATAAGGYARGANHLRVTPGGSYHVSAIALPGDAATTATLRAWDVTNGAELLSRSWSGGSAGRIILDVTVPSTCYEMSVHLGVVENGKFVDWDEVCVYELSTRTLPLPWWVKNKSQVRGMFACEWDYLAESVADPDPVLKLEGLRWNYLPAGFGANRTRITRMDSRPLRPVMLFGVRNETAYVNETETKRVDANFVNAALVFHLFRQLVSLPNSGHVDRAWVKEMVAYWEREYMRQRRAQEERLAMSFQQLGEAVISGRETLSLQVL